MTTADTYILRLANTSVANSIASMQNLSNPIIRLDANNNTYSVTIPESIRAKGKCFIKVSQALLSLEAGTAGGGERITDTEARMVLWQSNIPYLGFDTNTNGSSGAILAQTNVDIAMETAEALDAGLAKFTCPILPNEISITKLQISTDTSIPKRANNNDYLTSCIVVLQLTFDEDISHAGEREAFSNRDRF